MSICSASVVSCLPSGLGRHVGRAVFLIAWYCAWEQYEYGTSRIALCGTWEQCSCQSISHALSANGNSTSAGQFLIALRCAWEQWDGWAFSLTLWKVWDWLVSREQWKCFFIGLSCSIPTIVFYSFPFLFFLSICWCCGAGVFGLIGCTSLSLSQPCTADLF